MVFFYFIKKISHIYNRESVTYSLVYPCSLDLDS